MSDQTIRPMTADDIEAMVAYVAQWQPGDYIEPLVDHADGERGRRSLRVTGRREEQGPLGRRVYYAAVDRFGATFDVWLMDDPRRSNAGSFETEEPMS